MGGSLAAALAQRRANAQIACAHITGVARREATITEALERGIIDHGTCDLRTGVQDADLVILATPVRTIIRLTQELGPLLPAGCVLTDLGSTKQAVVQAMGRLPAHVQPLGGHPMCGREVAGLSAADPALFEGTNYILTPLPRTGAHALKAVREMVKAVGARPMLLSPARHDRLAAGVSHLPYLASVGLVACAEGLADSAAWDVAASGFQDMSRLSASDPSMVLDILLTNSAAIRGVLAGYRTELDNLDTLLANEDEAGFRAALAAAAQRRKSLFR